MKPFDNLKTPVSIKHFNMDSKSPLGQRGYDYTESSDSMCILQFSQSLIQDPRFADVKFIALSDRDDLSDNDHILFGGQEYKIVYSLPSKKYDPKLDNVYWLEIYG